ncbi:MAG: M3 family metallopeptidase, partial [Tepidiphilus sp.]|nr:M3 family metallopeptidase [Tepidiphilus sp.]
MNAPEHPLLHPFQLPPFDRLRPEDVEPVITELLARARAAIERAVDERTPPTWEDFVAPLERALEQLSDAWGVIGHLHSVMDTPAWREVYNKLLPEVTRFWTELGQNEALYRKTQALAQSPEFGRLSPERRRVIELDLRDHRLAGAELPPEKKPRHRDIQQELSALAAKFSENVLDATNAYQEWIEDEAQLSGIPEEVRAMAREAAQAQNRPGWCFTLQMPFYLPVMQYADDRALRERMYRAHATRASEFGPPERDNGPLIERILALRGEEALLLGYPDYASYSLVPKMANEPEEVASFLRELAARAKPFALRDLEELRAFARDTLGLDPLEPWDIAYASEKLRQARYDYSEQEVRRYLPLPRVLEGLFALLERL